MSARSSNLPLILSLETATTNCSVALSRGDRCLEVVASHSERYVHAERLHVFIKQILSYSNIEFNRLSAIAVGMGPGSYTGLRIGISAAKGLSYALGIPMIGIPTLEILARCISTNGLICSTLDARRMEVYTAIYNANYEEIVPTSAKIVTASFYKEYIDDASEFVIVGTGADKCRSLLNIDNIRFESTMPSAKEMVTVAYQKFNAKDFEDVVYCQPFYLKQFGE